MVSVVSMGGPVSCATQHAYPKAAPLRQHPCATTYIVTQHISYCATTYNILCHNIYRATSLCRNIYLFLEFRVSGRNSGSLRLSRPPNRRTNSKKKGGKGKGGAGGRAGPFPPQKRAENHAQRLLAMLPCRKPNVGEKQNRATGRTFLMHFLMEIVISGCPVFFFKQGPTV